MTTTGARSAAGRHLAGQVALVTGGSGGIGAAAARRLHELGATVHVASRSPDRTAAVAAEMGTEPIVADFGRLAEVRAAAAQVLERLRAAVGGGSAGLEDHGPPRGGENAATLTDHRRRITVCHDWFAGV